MQKIRTAKAPLIRKWLIKHLNCQNSSIGLLPLKIKVIKLNSHNFFLAKSNGWTSGILNDFLILPWITRLCKDNHSTAEKFFSKGS